MIFLDAVPAGTGSVHSLIYLARFGHFSACLLIFSDRFFHQFILDPSQRGAQGRGTMRRLVGVAMAIAFASGLGWFALTVADMAGVALVDATHRGILRLAWNHTSFGRLWKWRLMFWMSATVGSVVEDLNYPPRISGALKWIIFLSSGVLVGSLAWTGHGRDGGGALHLTADVLHLLLGACWPVGLLPFLLFLGRSGTLKASEDTDERAARLNFWRSTRRFSNVSLWCVGLLSMTGSVNGLYLAGSISALFHTSYGRMLLLKIGLMGALVALGGFNRHLLRGAKAEPDRQQAPIIGALQRSVCIELALAAVILGVVAVMGTQMPAACCR